MNVMTSHNYVHIIHKKKNTGNSANVDLYCLVNRAFFETGKQDSGHSKCIQSLWIGFKIERVS